MSKYGTEGNLIESTDFNRGKAPTVISFFRPLLGFWGNGHRCISDIFQYQYHNCRNSKIHFMLAASSGKSNVTVWRPSVCLSVPSAYSPWVTRRQHATRPDSKDQHTCIEDVALTGRNTTGLPCSRGAIIKLEAAWRHRLAAACRPAVQYYRRRRQTPANVTSLALYRRPVIMHGIW